MDPYVFLHDQAEVTAYRENDDPLDVGTSNLDHQGLVLLGHSRPSSNQVGRWEPCLRAGFGAFVETLLNRGQPLGRPAEAQITATLGLEPPKPAKYEAAKTPRVTNMLNTGPGTLFFNIHRKGHKVATVKALRATCRLGETVPLIVDFQGCDILCHSLRATLETVEEVHSSVAVRSETSIARATRRIYAQTTRNTLYSDSIFLEFPIPRNSTPAFKTSVIEMRWILRFNFMTSAESSSKVESEGQLEAALFDERGTVSSAPPILSCGNLEVVVPIQVGSSPPYTDVPGQRVDMLVR